MNNRPLLSNNTTPLRDQDSQTPPTKLSTRIPTPSITTNESRTLVDLRSTVARRFMRMLRAHDRTRQETLATYAAQPR